MNAPLIKRPVMHCRRNAEGQAVCSCSEEHQIDDSTLADVHLDEKGISHKWNWCGPEAPAKPISLTYDPGLTEPVEDGLEPSARYPSAGFRTPIDDFYEWGGWDHLPKRGEE